MLKKRGSEQPFKAQNHNEDTDTVNVPQEKRSDKSLDLIVTPGQLVLKRFLRNKLAILGVFILLFFFVFSFFGPYLMPYSEYQMNLHNNPQQRFYVTTGDNHLLRIRLGDGLFDWDLPIEKKITGLPQVSNLDGLLYLPVEGGLLSIDTQTVNNSAKQEFLEGLTTEDDLLSDVYEWPQSVAKDFEFEVNDKLQLIEKKTRRDGQIKERTLGGDDFKLADENAYYINTEGMVIAYDKDGLIQEFRPGQRSKGWSVNLRELGYKPPFNIVASMAASLEIDRYAKPSSKHLLGTDIDGRDVLTRLMYGGRISLMVGFCVVFIQILLGVIMGGIAGFYGGWVDNIIMRLVDIFFCLPQLPLIMMINTSLTKTNIVSPQNGIYILMFVLGVLGWAGVGRFVRGQILSLREQEYMIAAEATGLRVSKRIFRHLIPNVMPLLIVMATLGIGGTILFESSLSFLGFGLQYPYASWGNMVNPVTDPIVMKSYLNIWVPPGLCILLTVLAFNFVGDGLRDALDPRMKR